MFDWISQFTADMPLPILLFIGGVFAFVLLSMLVGFVRWMVGLGGGSNRAGSHSSRPSYDQQAGKLAAQEERQRRWRQSMNNPMNPNSPLNPMNPMNPNSPLNPMNPNNPNSHAWKARHRH